MGLAELDRRSVAYDKSIEKAGKLVIAQALQSVKTSMTVRKRSGKVVMTDGPFAETKEQLLGFVMLEAESLEEALDDRRRHPDRRMGHDRGPGGLRRSRTLDPDPPP